MALLIEPPHAGGAVFIDDHRQIAIAECGLTMDNQCIAFDDLVFLQSDRYPERESNYSSIW